MKYFSSEDELLKNIRKWIPSPAAPFGIGDDAAFLNMKKGAGQVVTTDFLVEGIDFKNTDDLKKVGRKSLAVNLSDLAAMGAKPVSALIYLGFPKGSSRRSFRKIFRGWNDLARKYGVKLIGGDLSRAPVWMVGTVLIGAKLVSKGFLRSGARRRDSLWVTGNLGGSLLGKHFNFEPRVREALFLAEHFSVTSCIDLSDGLGQDLPRLLKASKKGAELDLDRIPISRSAWRIAHNDHSKALRHAFQDGEDFELLFTVPASQDEKLLKLWKRRFKTPLTQLGTITAGKGVRVFSKGKTATLSPNFWKAFDHFR